MRQLYLSAFLIKSHSCRSSWEASSALKKKLSTYGIPIEGRPGGWAETYRVYKECKFVEDDGDVIFFKNACGLAQMRPLLPETSASDSGIEVDNKP
jgi:omega-6 fatty acid desaturase (delta-12 desaturase)